MLKPITIGALCLAFAMTLGCSREDPRASRETLLDGERERSSEQMHELRDRLGGQARR